MNEWQQPEAPQTEWIGSDGNKQRVVIRKSGLLWAWQVQTFTLAPWYNDLWYNEEVKCVWRNRFFDPHGHCFTQKAAEKAARKVQQQTPYILALTSDER